MGERIFDEFGSLYANQHGPRFTGFIDAGKYTELGDLPSFQKEISESKGYRKYCSTVMKSSYRMFSQQEQPRDAEDDLSDEDTNTPKL